MATNLVRPPAVAGQFYEADPERLKAGIEKLLATAPAPKKGVLVRAMVLPHAGYVYSGKTAVETMALARDGKYKRAVVIAPSHRVGFEGLAVAPFSAFRTPLGDVPVDLEAVGDLLAEGNPLVALFPQAHSKEHALEVELPLLQTILPPMPIVPLVAGQLSLEAVKEIAKSLKQLWNPETLWIVSSDFTHYGESFGYVPFTDSVPDRLRELDLGAAKKAAEMDLEGFELYLRETGATICGAVPITLLLATADNVEGRVAAYANSGESTRDWSHCVGYVGLSFEQKDPSQQQSPA